MTALFKKNIKKKSRKNKLDSKKQMLCDRIRRSTSIKELKGWEKTFSYHCILKNDEEWDYDFLLTLIEFKLKRMRNYFWTTDSVENEKEYGNICDRLINILHAGYKTNIIVDRDLKNYVNTRNVHRFFYPKQLEFILKRNLQKYYLPTVRETKAKALFWKYLGHKIEYLWD